MSKRKTATGEFLSPREFADLLGIHRESVYRALARSELSAVRVGRALRLPKSQLDNLLIGTDADNQAEQDEW